MKTVLYSHDLSIAPRQLFILKQNPDKTVDIGIAGTAASTKGGVVTAAVPARLLVGSCPVSDMPKAGHCVMQEEVTEVAASEPSGAPDKDK